MRLEEFTGISDTLKFMTDEQLVKLSDLVRININVRRMRNKVEIEGCESKAAQLRNNIEVLSGARIGDTVRERLDRKSEVVAKARRLTRTEIIAALRAQGIEDAQGYRKGDFIERAAKAEVGRVEELVKSGIVVTSKGWYRFSDEVAGCVRVTHA